MSDERGRKSLAQLYGVKDNVETFEDLAYHFWCFNPLSFFKKSLQNDRFDRADIARFNIGNFRVTVLLGYGDTKMSMAAATYLYIYGNPGDDVSATTKMILNEVIIKDGTLSGFKEFISKYNIDIRDDVNVRRSVTCGVKE